MQKQMPRFPGFGDLESDYPVAALSQTS
jgi:hypothetical protein